MTLGLRIRPTRLATVLLIEPAVFGDTRGRFVECWHRARYVDGGLPATFVQDNVSRSAHAVLRGLHVQEPHGQGKLVQVLDGEVFDVAVDVRVGSPTFGQWVGEALSGETHRQMYIPSGFAHGFCVLSESALLMYKCTDFYHPESELGIAWSDPTLGIAWPISEPILSEKDASAKTLRDIAPDRLPRYQP
jgi:dTDP-4-dehydrorhamnose 3,5-epimerase